MILSKAEYIASINSILPDNATQEISPLDLRTSLINLIDSVPNFMYGQELTASNFSTPELRTTLGGELALSSLQYAGRTSVDNSAFGFAALRNNFDGSGNTAIGSHALGCNLYGSSNTALGLLALAGNTAGSGNIGIGNLTLHNNKKGDFNIAIGHGAGWHIGPDSDYNFVVGVAEIATEGTCDEDGNSVFSNPQSPLLFGDLDPTTHRLAVGTESLHNFGMLQVSGDVSPTTSGDFNLGRSQRPWSSINEEIFFSGGNVGVGGNPSGDIHGVSDGRMTVYGDLVPSLDERYALGHPNLKWDAYLNDVIISGMLFVNKEEIVFQNVTQCLYECKTLHLATSGFCDPEDEGFHNSSVCGFLNDESLDGAGFEIHSSGTGGSYRRDYRFIYKSPDPIVTCLEYDNAYTRSRWQSNISLQIESGRHVQTDRIISNNGVDHFSIVHQSGCMGMFIEPISLSGQRMTFQQEEHRRFQEERGEDYYGLTDYNFISRSGTHKVDGNPVGYNFGVTYGTVDSGVKVMQRFLSRIQSNAVRGFSFVYHDERDSDGDINCDQLGYPDLDCVNNPGLPECAETPE